MRTTLVLKNGFKYRGEILSENADQIIISDLKLGRTTILKCVIGVRSDSEGEQ